MAQHFTVEERSFLMLSFAHGMSTPAMIADFKEVYPGVCDDEDKLHERLKKLKAKYEPEIAEIAEKLKSDLPVFALPEWRIFYFRRLLSEAKSPETKIRLLKEIRAESKLLLGETPARPLLPEPEGMPELIPGGAALWKSKWGDLGMEGEGSGEEDTTADGEGV